MENNMENKNLDNYSHTIKKLERCLYIWNIIIIIVGFILLIINKDFLKHYYAIFMLCFAIGADIVLPLCVFAYLDIKDKINH